MFVLPDPCLMLVTDRHQCQGDLVKVVVRAVQGGVHAVQLREKDLPANELLALGVGLRRALREPALLLVNDRADVAMAAGADGVHLPENGLPPEEARVVVRRKLVGRSVHTLEGALLAERGGADYLLFGNVYETASHPGAPGAGPDGLAEITAAVAVPVLAIGGIAPERVPEVMAAGASGVAVISSILGAPEPGRAAAELLAAMRTGMRAGSR